MLNRIHVAYLEGYSEPCQNSKKELFTQIVNGLKLGSEYTSDIYRYTVQMQETFLVSLCLL